MDIVITTSDPNEVEDFTESLWSFIEREGFFVNSIEVHSRKA